MRKTGPKPGTGSKGQEEAYGDSIAPVVEDTEAAAAAAAAAEKAAARRLEVGKTCLLNVLSCAECSSKVTRQAGRP